MNLFHMARTAKREVAATLRIFLPKRLINSNRQGFTLVEMIIVVGLIAILTTVALPSVTSFFKMSVKTFSRDFGRLVQETYHSTMASGKIHRIVYDFKKNQYWVESAPRDAKLDRSKPLKDELQRSYEIPEDEEDEEEEEKNSAFSLETDVTEEKKDLPRGVVFKDVVNEQQTEPVKGGQAYTHFFPHGLAEQTILHIKDSQDHEVSLVISPLMGKTEYISGYADQEEVFGVAANE